MDYSFLDGIVPKQNVDDNKDRLGVASSRSSVSFHGIASDENMGKVSDMMFEDNQHPVQQQTQTDYSFLDNIVPKQTIQEPKSITTDPDPKKPTDVGEIVSSSGKAIGRGTFDLIKFPNDFAKYLETKTGANKTFANLSGESEQQYQTEQDKSTKWVDDIAKKLSDTPEERDNLDKAGIGYKALHGVAAMLGFIPQFIGVKGIVKGATESVLKSATEKLAQTYGEKETNKIIKYALTKMPTQALEHINNAVAGGTVSAEQAYAETDGTHEQKLQAAIKAGEQNAAFMGGAGIAGDVFEPWVSKLGPWSQKIANALVQGTVFGVGSAAMGGSTSENLSQFAIGAATGGMERSVPKEKPIEKPIETSKEESSNQNIPPVSTGEPVRDVVQTTPEVRKGNTVGQSQQPELHVSDNSEHGNVDQDILNTYQYGKEYRENMRKDYADDPAAIAEFDRIDSEEVDQIAPKHPETAQEARIIPRTNRLSPQEGSSILPPSESENQAEAEIAPALMPEEDKAQEQTIGADNDTKDQTGISGKDGEGEASIQEKPIEETSKEKTTTGGDVQTSGPEKVIQDRWENIRKNLWTKDAKYPKIEIGDDNKTVTITKNTSNGTYVTPNIPVDASFNTIKDMVNRTTRGEGRSMGAKNKKVNQIVSSIQDEEKRAKVENALKDKSLNDISDMVNEHGITEGLNTAQQDERDIVLKPFVDNAGTTDYTDNLYKQLQKVVDNKNTLDKSEGENNKRRPLKVEDVFDISGNSKEDVSKEITDMYKSGNKFIREAVLARSKRKSIPQDKALEEYIDYQFKKSGGDGKKIISVKDPLKFEELRGGRGKIKQQRNSEIDTDQGTVDDLHRGAIEEATDSQVVKDRDMVNDEETTDEIPEEEISRSTKHTTIQNNEDKVTDQDVDDAVINALQLFGGDNHKFKVVIGKTRTTKSGKEQQVLSDNDLGAYYRDKDGTPVFHVHPDIPKKELMPTLMEEMVGHFGAEKVIKQLDGKFGEYTRDLFSKDRESAFTNSLEKTYFPDGKVDEEKLYEEWLAHRGSDAAMKYFSEKGDFQQDIYDKDVGVVKQFYHYIKNIISRMYKQWIGTPATEQEIDLMAKNLVMKMRDIKEFSLKDEEIISYKDAGYKTEAEFNKHYGEKSLKEVGESKDEFLQRVLCGGMSYSKYTIRQK